MCAFEGPSAGRLCVGWKPKLKRKQRLISSSAALKQGVASVGPSNSRSAFNKESQKAGRGAALPAAASRSLHLEGVEAHGEQPCVVAGR